MRQSAYEYLMESGRAGWPGKIPVGSILKAPGKGTFRVERSNGYVISGSSVSDRTRYVVIDLRNTGATILKLATNRVSRQVAKSIRAAMTNIDKAICFWEQIDRHFPTIRVKQHLQALRRGEGDWFRNYGLCNIALSKACRFGRIGFDQEKYERLQKWARATLVRCGLSISDMQN